MGEWFPKPPSPQDIRLVGARGALSSEDLFELLHREGAEEWRSKVGVAGRADGSAKPTTRLLAAGEWVLKSDVGRAGATAGELSEELSRVAALARRTGLWHPTKQWAVFWTGESWLPLSVCRRLVSLRAVEPVEARIEGWSDMIALGVQAAVERGVGLDLNPANFGFEDLGGRLYYVDDETTTELGWSELASAVAGRLPEEPDADDDDLWRAWGRRLREIVAPLCREGPTELVEELERYPLVPRFATRLDALVAGLRSASRRREQARRAPSLTCVFGDVHANLPALEAVLAAAEAAGVDSYLFMGDAVGYGPWPKACVERLAELPGAVFVRGNHDHAIASGELAPGMNHLARRTAEWTAGQLGEAERRWLASLAPEYRGDDWLAVHGAPKDPHRFFAYVYELTYENNLDRLEELAIPLCFFGHTHVSAAIARTPSGHTRKLMGPAEVNIGSGSLLLVNPGSAGQPRDGDRRAAYALWDRRAQRIAMRRVPYPIERTCEEIRAQGLPPELIDRLELGR